MLSGKYTRETPACRRPIVGNASRNFLTERNYVIIDEVARVGRELGCAPAAVALAWVQAQPGVTSTIIGARRADQLAQNLSALEVTLTPAHSAALNAVSEPVLNFPAGMLKFVGMFSHGGLTVNGATAPSWPMSPTSDDDCYSPRRARHGHGGVGGAEVLC